MRQCLLFSHLDRKRIEVRFHSQSSSSDADSILLKFATARTAQSRALAANLRDQRSPSQTAYACEELLRQRASALI